MSDLIDNSYTLNVRLRQLPLFYRRHKGSNRSNDIKIIGMIRERNESLLLKDTLDYMAKFVDGIIVFDDASTDDSVQIALDHESVLEVIANKHWRKAHRVWEETSNRKKLHDIAKSYEPTWIFYGDADERCEGDIRKFLLEDCPSDTNVLRISLFDAYMTRADSAAYQQGDQLYDFRKKFGPERRDIVMAWRNNSGADFIVKDAREPQNIVDRKEITKFFCQHYGKSLSIEQWEETCDYYVKYFPKYKIKWEARKGKGIHTQSDFGRELFTWSQVKKNAVKL